MKNIRFVAAFKKRREVLDVGNLNRAILDTFTSDRSNGFFSRSSRSELRAVRGIRDKSSREQKPKFRVLQQILFNKSAARIKRVSGLTVRRVKTYSRDATAEFLPKNAHTNII